jgi:hypothetical protein
MSGEINSHEAKKPRTQQNARRFFIVTRPPKSHLMTKQVDAVKPMKNQAQSSTQGEI